MKNNGNGKGLILHTTIKPLGRWKSQMKEIRNKQHTVNKNQTSFFGSISRGIKREPENITAYNQMREYETNTQKGLFLETQLNASKHSTQQKLTNMNWWRILVHNSRGTR